MFRSSQWCSAVRCESVGWTCRCWMMQIVNLYSACIDWFQAHGPREPISMSYVSGARAGQRSAADRQPIIIPTRAAFVYLFVCCNVSFNTHYLSHEFIFKVLPWTAMLLLHEFMHYGSKAVGCLSDSAKASRLLTLAAKPLSSRALVKLNELSEEHGYCSCTLKLLELCC